MSVRWPSQPVTQLESQPCTRLDAHSVRNTIAIAHSVQISPPMSSHGTPCQPDVCIRRVRRVRVGWSHTHTQTRARTDSHTRTCTRTCTHAHTHARPHTREGTPIQKRDCDSTRCLMTTPQVCLAPYFKRGLRGALRRLIRTQQGSLHLWLKSCYLSSYPWQGHSCGRWRRCRRSARRDLLLPWGP